MKRFIPSIIKIFLKTNILKIQYLYRNYIRNEDFKSFQCNICGKKSYSPLKDIIARETPSCNKCGSNLRHRSIIYALSNQLFQDDIPVSSFKLSKNLTGIGLSDSTIHSNPLKLKFNYTNTFYHKEPLLDIVGDISKYENKIDFIISSEVFEHIPPPIDVGFSNMYKILKNGGIVIFSVPYKKTGETIEHFPNLLNYEIIEKNGKKVLKNKTINGKIEYFDELVFHGGPGATLEMRYFSENSLLKEIKKAGFKNVKIFNQNCEKFGIFNNRQNSFVISMQKII
tara:strand:- start:1321 stop:2169 length:849 start_codon:yes stop_codon:yes gene_type:complete